MRKLFVPVLLFCAWIFFCGVSGMQISSNPLPPPGFKEISIPFTLNSEGLMVVKGEISGHPANLMVDTGMDAPVSLFGDFCEKVMLPPDGYKAEVHIFGERDPRLATVLENFGLTLGGVSFGIDQGLELRDSSIFTNHPDQIDGVIGWGFLSHFDLIIDYPSRMLTLRNPDSNPSGDARAVMQGMRLDPVFFPVVTIHLLGKEPSFLIDTGSPGSWISYKFLNYEGNGPQYPPSSARIQWICRVPSLQVDQASLQNLSLNVVRDFSSRSGTEEFQGILGLNALSGNTLELDPARGLAVIVPGPWRGHKL